MLSGSCDSSVWFVKEEEVIEGKMSKIVFFSVFLLLVGAYLFLSPTTTYPSGKVEHRVFLTNPDGTFNPFTLTVEESKPQQPLQLLTSRTVGLSCIVAGVAILLVRDIRKRGR